MLSKKHQSIYFCIFTAVYWFAAYIYSPYITPYVESLGADNMLLGIMVGALGLAQIFIRIPMGMLSDRLQNRKLFIILGAVIGFAAVGGLWLTTNVWVIIAMRVLTGVSASCWMFFCVLYNSYFPPHESVKAQGILLASNLGGQAVSFLVAGYVAKAFHVRSIFFVAMIFFAISFVMSFFIKEIKTAAPARRYSLRDVLTVAKDRWVTKITVMGSIYHMILFGAYLGFTPQLATRLGADEMDLAILALLFAFSSVPASFLCGAPFMKRVGDRKILIGSTTIYVFCCVLQPFCQTMAALLVLQCIAGFSRGFTQPVLIGLVTKNTPYEKQAVVTGYYQAVYSIGIMMGPIIIGAISQATSLIAAYSVLGIIGLIMPSISYFGLREQTNDRALCD
ncbi:MAG: MFS transporter [Christensenellales bacterium]